MNWNWYQLRRMRSALILIWLGVVFLLEESGWFHWDAWPLFLIGLGVILLVERMIPLPPPQNPYPPPQYPAPYGYQQPPVPPAPQQAAPPPENPSTSSTRTGNWS